MILPKIFFTDIDGVWTDGSMYYDQEGNELKRFHTYDSAGVLWCRKLGIEVCIITGEKTNIVKRRAEKLSIPLVYQGVKDKVTVASEVLQKIGATWDEAAYIGDDINDIPLLSKVGLSACPKNANYYIQEMVDIKLETKGGDGAFRTFVESVLEKHDLLAKLYDDLKQQ